MDKKKLLDSIKKARNVEKGFKQKFDLIINLKNLNLKKPEQNINTFIALPCSVGKKIRIGAFVGDELITKAKTVCDPVIHKNDFVNYKNKKNIKNLARKCDFFIAQANLMTEIASVFGKTLGPIGKMPNPKAGCVIPPLADLKPLIEKLSKTVKVQTKNELTIKTLVGNEEMKDDEIAENILYLYNQILHLVPQEKNNIKSIYLKLTMGKPVQIEDV